MFGMHLFLPHCTRFVANTTYTMIVPGRSWSIRISNLGYLLGLRLDHPHYPFWPCQYCCGFIAYHHALWRVSSCPILVLLEMTSPSVGTSREPVHVQAT